MALRNSHDQVAIEASAEAVRVVLREAAIEHGGLVIVVEQERVLLGVVQTNVLQTSAIAK